MDKSIKNKPAKFNLNYFNRENAKTQSHKKFKPRVFATWRLKYNL